MGDIGPLSALAALRHLALRALASKPDACWEVRTRSKLHPLGVSLHWALWPACTSVEAGGAVGLAMQVDACCENSHVALRHLTRLTAVEMYPAFKGSIYRVGLASGADDIDDLQALASSAQTLRSLHLFDTFQCCSPAELSALTELCVSAAACGRTAWDAFQPGDVGDYQLNPGQRIGSRLGDCEAWGFDAVANARRPATSLLVLNLDGVAVVEDCLAAGLGGLPMLRELHLSRCHHITGIAVLQKVASQLRGLHLSFCFRLDWRCFQALTRLQGLRRLDLSEMLAVCDGGMPALGASLPSSLTGLKIGGLGTWLAGYRQSKEEDDNGLTDAGVAAFADSMPRPLPQLQALAVARHAGVGDAAAAALASGKLPGLTQLDVRGAELLGDAGLAALTRLSVLESLFLKRHAHRCSADGLRQFREWRDCLTLC